MESNHLRQEDRIRIGKEAEALILSEINERCPLSIGGKTFTAFTPASEEQDMHKKIDAFAWNWSGEGYSVQIKNRESGLDLGLALMRPYEGDNWFCSNYKSPEGDLHWDRDMIGRPDYYLIANEGQICLVESKTVHNGVMAILSSLYTHGGFNGGNTHKYSALDGLTLKLVKDIGAGYSVGQYKVICYIALDALASRGAFLEQR